MITNFQKQSHKDDVKLLVWIVVGFLFIAWFCSPPGNKLLQLCFWGNNTKYFITKLFSDNSSTEYIFHRNNAVYLAKMYPDKPTALKEMNKAIETLPSFASDAELRNLYKDRAEIRLFLGDHKGALNDFINSDLISFSDNLKVAMLFKVAGNYKEAMNYCNAMLNQDPFAYAGFACMAEIYLSVDRPDVALRVWNLALDRNKNNPRAYVDRALVKKAMGDLSGYNTDLKLAREYSPAISEEDSIIEDSLHPKILALSVR